MAKIKARMQHKIDTEANWLLTENRFIPLKGEFIIYDKDSNYSTTRLKIGDGKTDINNLSFMSFSAYDIAKAQGFEGNEEEWLKSLEGRGISSINILQQAPIGSNNETKINISLTDGSVSDIFSIYNGEQGEPGPQGETGQDGYTPEKGIDYFTNDDISTITSSVINTLPIETEPIKNSLNPISSGAVKTALDNVIAIAEGKCATYVFDYYETLEDVLTSENQDIDFISSLNAGDIFLIRDLEVPDYWWEPQGNTLMLSEQTYGDIVVDGYGVARVLETIKCDLDDYSLIGHTHVVEDIVSGLSTVAKTGSYKDLINVPNISNRGYAGDAIWYFPLGEMVIDNSGNYGNFTFTGRLGGWLDNNTAIYSIMIMNRSSGYTGDVITSTVSSSGQLTNALNLVDIVISKNSDKSHTVYLKCKNYFCFDFSWTAYQHSIIYDGTYTTTAPSNIIWQLSTAPKTVLDTSGKFTASGGIGGLATVATTGNYNDLIQKPTELPANGGNADTVDSKHIVVSSSAPTVNDTSIITIVI